jgi:hypothetical protein
MQEQRRRDRVVEVYAVGIRNEVTANIDCILLPGQSA